MGETRTGWLLYKCKLCGRVEKSLHVPDVAIILGCILRGEPLPKSWIASNIVKRTSLHHCEEGRTGIMDLIGGTIDKD